MKNVAVVYLSKYGHTKQYAEWLKEDLGADKADVIEISRFNVTQVLAYKLIIFACGVYGDKMAIMDFIKKNLSSIPAQKTMVMAVSWYTNDSEDAKKKLIEDNFPDTYKNSVPLYIINSGIDKKKISPMDNMKLLASQVLIEKKDGRSSDDINALAIIKGYSDQTSKDNLASVKNAIDEFFAPKKKAEPEPALKKEPSAPRVVIPDYSVKTEDAPVETPAPKQAPTPAPTPVSAPAPKPAPIPVSNNFVDASNVNSDADALSSLENAFKALRAPKAAPTPAPTPTPAVEEVSAPVVKEIEFEEVSAPIAKEIEFEEVSAPVAKEIEFEEVSAPVAKEIEFEEVSAPVAKEIEFEEISAPVAKKIELEEVSAPVAKEIELEEVSAPVDKEIEFEEVSAPVVEPVKQEEVSEPEPVVPEPEVKTEAPKKNSYMELFARRRKAIEESAAETEAAVPEVKPEPIPEAAVKPEPQAVPDPIIEPVPVVKPAPISKPEPAPKSSEPDFYFELNDTVVNTAPVVAESAPQTNVKAALSMDMDVYDFISEDTAPAVSSRALNAVQDLAKAKEKAAMEAAKKAAEAAAEAAEAAAAAEKAAEEVHRSEFSEQMKHDIEELAREAEAEEIKLHQEAQEEAESEIFLDDINAAYGNIKETVEVVEVEEADNSNKENDPAWEIKKLTEEINASIEQNRATKEKMMARYNKKPKEEVRNPFAVQFDDDEDDKKKKKKKQAPEPKRLADPIDPDIFFSRPGKNYEMPGDTMPEIKFNSRK